MCCKQMGCLDMTLDFYLEDSQILGIALQERCREESPE